MSMIFTYGTLKKGLSNHHLLENSEFISKARTEDNKFLMYNISGAYPAVKPVDYPANFISGELYDVNEEVVKELDILEGYPEYYDKMDVDIVDMAGSIYRAKMYFMSGSMAVSCVVLGGTWR